MEKSKKEVEGKGKKLSKVISDAGYYIKISGNAVRDEVIRRIRKEKKRSFGEYVVSKRFENIRKEIIFK